jgi:hypothetical protein
MCFLDSGKRGNPIFVQYATMYFLIQVVNGVGMHERKMMRTGKRMLLLAAWVASWAGGTGFMMQEAGACTKILYVGDRNMVATGRNMDWRDRIHSIDSPVMAA